MTDHPPASPAPQVPDLSSCCRAPLRVVSSDEGTNYYICSKCGKPTDPATPQAALREENARLLVTYYNPSCEPLASSLARTDAKLAECEKERDEVRNNPPTIFSSCLQRPRLG
jgi:hypothetical protein